MSELRIRGGRLEMERSCQWRPFHWPAPFSPEFPLTLLSSTHPVTGETRLVLRDAQLNELLYAVLAPIPAARGVTAIRWRAKVAKAGGALHRRMILLGNPLAVHDAVDARALRALKPTVSLHGAELRAALEREHADAAA